ncbi:MAG: DMT family transporter [Thermoanaerobaculum sp.]|nr:DMT family transporter [Thermoanaerobaculum sp.]MCX7894603.1 DMT family transporter [Thermoanaerobaculum sp.]MDW7967285.1 DMT family transporter [Thermoanaerobaculum sp.]
MGRWKAVWLLLLVTVVWGATFPVVKGALNVASLGVFLSLRFALAFVVLLVAARGPRPPHLDLASLGCGLALFAGYALQTAGLSQTLPSRSAFITSFSVILVPLLEWLVKGRPPRGRVWVAAVLALVGLFLLLQPEQAPLTLGDGLTFACAVAFAAHVLTLERAVQRQHPTAVNTVQMAVVALLSPTLILAEPARVQWNPELILALLITGILASALAFGAMARVLLVLKAGETGVVLAFEPVAATLVSVALGYETVTFPVVVGGLLVVTGVALVARES